MAKYSLLELLNLDIPEDNFISSLCMSEKYKIMKIIFLISSSIDEEYIIEFNTNNIKVTYDHSNGQLYLVIDNNFNLNLSDKYELNIKDVPIDKVINDYRNFIATSKNAIFSNISFLSDKQKNKINDEKQKVKFEAERLEAVKANLEKERQELEEKKKAFSRSSYSSQSYSHSSYSSNSSYYSKSYSSRSYGRTCPYCGSKLVLRHRNSDGHPFYGCSRFPSCRYTENL